MQPERNSVEAIASAAEEVVSQARAEGLLAPENDPEWAGLLGYLLNARGFDFHGYKPASLARRIRKRMEAVGAGSFAAYQDYLEVHPKEFATLFNVILINVTGFFRDPTAWEAVRTIALPQIVSSKGPTEPIRAWAAGCATGEEAYTIAMMLAEELGADQVRERVKIYATDVDEDALNTARQAAYQERQVEGVPPELLSKYFEHLDGIYLLRKDLRRQVIFGRHDLINDAPISRIDLLTCRNTLMYLNAETQARVLARLHFALSDGGFLLVGRAETLMAHGQSFVPVDLKRRLSRKSSRAAPRDGSIRREEVLPTTLGGAGQESRARATALEARRVQRELKGAHQDLEKAYEELQSTNDELRTMNEELQATNEELQAMNDDLRQRGDELNFGNFFLDSVLDGLRSAVAVVDREYRVLAWNDKAEELWGLKKDDVNGHHLLNLDIGLPIEHLRPLLRNCLNGDDSNGDMPLAAINRRGRAIRCMVHCTPLRGPEDDVRGAIIFMEESGDSRT